MWKTPELEEIQATLRDPTSLIGMRMRAAYYAKQLFVDLQKEEKSDDDTSNSNSNSNSNKNKNEEDGLSRTQKMEDIVTVLCEQVFVKEHGSLLRHEFAYVLGQMKTDRACTTLENLLLKEDDCVMVRHEAAEALGAIASLKSKSVLEITRIKNEGTLDELSDTCLLALNRLNHVTSENDDDDDDDNNDKKNSLVVGCACMLAPYNSIDPVEVDPAHISLSTTKLGDILLNSIQDTSTNDDNDNNNNNNNNNSIGYQRRGDLIERYRAMFSLRNRGGEESVRQLCRALVEDTSSPLLRHEVAFVLGQLQHPCSISALEESLSRLDEHAMVRHESAEALGAIEGSSEEWERIESILTKYQKDFDPAVAESCIVALDAADYWGSNGNSNDNNSIEDDTVIDHAESSQSTTVGGLFGKQKHASTVATSEIRKHILAQHFNVVQTA
jgi:deoxyhypusine monooxygenase